MKNKRWVIVVIILVLAIGGGWGYVNYQNQQRTINTDVQLSVIRKTINHFGQEKNAQQKLDILKTLIKDSKHYQQTQTKSTKVNKTYQLAISKAQQYFKDQNQQVLKANTIQYKSVSDATIQTKNRRLNGLLTTVKDQGTTVYTKPALKAITNQVKETIKANQQQATDTTTSSSVETERVTTQSEKKSTAMALDEIKTGNYQSLLGDWQEVAVSFNRHDGKGNIWESGSRGDGLDITANQIKNGPMTIVGNTLNDGTDSHKLIFDDKAGYLNADTNDAAVIWNVSFYPKDIALTNWGDDVPTTVDENKDRLIIRTSNNNYVEVFQRDGGNEAQTTVDDEKVESKQSMALDEVKAGNYKSLNGTWQNGLGNQITVKNEIMQFTDITSNKEPGTITGQQLDIPSSDGPDGTPKEVSYIGDSTMKAYNQTLTTEENNGVFSLRSTLPGAALYISFLPKGTMGDVTGGDVNKDKIIAVGTQNSSTAVGSEQVYYKIS